MTTVDERPTPATALANVELGYWTRQGLAEHLARIAVTAPARELVVDRVRRLTYGEAVPLVRRAAAGLRKLGVAPKQCVLVQVANWHEAVVLHLALEAIGAVAVPLPPVFRAREVKYIAGLTDAVAAIFAHRLGEFDYAELYAELGPSLPTLRHRIVVRPVGAAPAGTISYESLLEAQAEEVEPELRSDPDAVMEIGFTSGSTGDPKGAVHTSNTLSFEHRTWSKAHGLGEDDVFFVPSTIGHQLGYSVMRAAILCGAKMVFIDRWEPEAATAIMHAEGASFLITTPAFLFDVLKTRALAELGGLPRMRVWVLAGQVVTSELHKEATSMFPHVRFARQFGMTEIGSMIINNMAGPADKAMATGIVQPGAELRVVDADLCEVPTGEVGELILRAPSMFFGYYKRPDLTAPWFTSDGFFRTGDEVRVDEDGWLWVTGRIKDLIKRGGESISPAEIEDILSGHPKLLEASVVGVPDPRLGERVCVCAIVRPGQEISLEEIVAWVSKAGVARQKWPEALVLLDELPRTSIGKIHKALVRDLATRTLATRSA
jgi:cyclohexanecarboxylate-CoA ligase